ncbi:hypothetical protein ACWD4O_43545 [Streptomyces sp. NPDC002623]
MPATEPQPPSQAQPSRPFTLAGLSMRDLLASCAAAEAVSTPPRLPDPGLTNERVERVERVDHPRAA